MTGPVKANYIDNKSPTRDTVGASWLNAVATAANSVMSGISKIRGVDVSATAPTAGQAFIASSPSAAGWEDLTVYYDKPLAGIPVNDLEAQVQQSLVDADSAVQPPDLDAAMLIPVRTVTANDSVALQDMFGVIEVDSPTPVNITIPPHSSVPFPVFGWTKIRQIGAGAATLIKGTGVNINGPDSATTRAQWCTLTAHKRTINSWVIEGDAATAAVPPPPTTVAFSTSSNASENNSDGILSVTHTPVAGATIAFVDIAVGKFGGGLPSAYTRTVTYDGQPMTSLAAVASNNGTGGFVETFYVWNPAIAAKTVAVTVTLGAGASPLTLIIGVTSYAGVGSLGTPVTGFTGTAGTPSVTVASATNHMVHAAFVSGSAIASPTDATRVAVNLSNGNSAGNLLVQDQLGATSAVLGAAANADNWAWIGVDLIPGAPPLPSLLPDITTIAPNPGPAGAVVLTGTNFLTGATVSFGGAAATGVTVVSATQINCTAPAHADGAVNVTVTTTAGTSDFYVFTYQAVSGARNPLIQPFASDSIWNTPIGSGAVYVNCNYTADPTNNPQRVIFPDPMLICLTPTAPQVSIRYSSGSPSRCNPTSPPSYMTDPVQTNVPIPTNYVSSTVQGNSSAAFLMADGRRLIQVQYYVRCTAGAEPTCSFRNPGNPAVSSSGPDADLYTDGRLGAHGASRLSVLGGTLRLGEMRPGQPTGPKHALKITIDVRTKLYNASVTADTFRWPAISADADALTSYGSTVSAPSACKMGSLLALHSSLDITTIGLETTPGFQFAWTLQNYGMYIAERGGTDANAICMEEGVNGSFSAQFQSDWGYPFQERGNSNNAWFRDWERILVRLYVVDNNSPTSIGGGGTPRQALAPSIGPGP
jgi:hypothetical protein